MPPNASPSCNTQSPQSYSVRFYHRTLFWFPVGLLLGCVVCFLLLPFLQQYLLEREVKERIFSLQQDIDLQNTKNSALEKEIARLNTLLAGDPCESVEQGNAALQ